MKDIAEKFEEEFENCTKLWQTTLDAISQSIFLIDLNHKILQCNRATLDILGKSSYSEINGHSCWELVHRTSGPVEWCPVRRMRQTGQREATIQMINDKRVEISADPVFNDKGEIIGAVHIITDITARKEAEEKLKVSEEKYKNMINNLMDIIIILDLKGNFQYISPQVYEVSGFKPEEIIGKNGFKLIHPDDVRKAAEVLKEALKHKKRIYIEYRTLHKEGHYIDVSASGRIVNIDGEDRIFAIVRDTTDQKISEKKLKQSEEKYRHLFENSPYYIILLNQNWDILDCNISTENIFKYPKQELIGRNIVDIPLIESEKIEFLRKRADFLFKGGKLNYIEMKVPRKDGALIWVKSKASLIKIGDQLLLHIIGEDITNQKLTELKQKESEDKYRYLIENALEGVWVIDSKADTVLVNPSMAKILGYFVEEMIGKSVFSFMDEDQIKNTKLHLEKRKEGISEERDAILIHKNGDKVFLRIRATPIFDDKGNYEGTFAFLTDITERKLSEEKLKTTEMRLRSLIEQTTDAVFCYEFIPPIPINLPIEQQVKLMYNCVLVDCNLVCAQSYGANRVEDVIGRKLTDLFGITPSSLDKLFRDVIDGGYRIVDGVGIEKAPDGQDRYFFNNGYGVIEDGKLVRIWGTFRDITDRIKAEQKLKESEENFRTIAEQAFMGILIIQDEKVEYVNNALLQIFEYTYEDIRNWVKDDLLKIIHHDDLQFLREYRQKLRADDPNVKPYYSYRAFTKSGKLKWIDQFSKPIFY
ncbi:MAG: PAS domain-containing protein, partial [Candidatus Hodarchaeota archaeon]